MFVDDHPIVVTRVMLLTFVRHCKRVKVLTLDFRTCTIATSERERDEWTRPRSWLSLSRLSWISHLHPRVPSLVINCVRREGIGKAGRESVNGRFARRVGVRPLIRTSTSYSSESRMEQLQATTSTCSADAAGIADCQEPSEPATKKPKKIDGDEWSSGRGDPDRGTSRDPDATVATQQAGLAGACCSRPERTTTQPRYLSARLTEPVIL